MSRAKTTTRKRKKAEGDRCNVCHHLIRLHYFKREGVECGRCGETRCWSEKTGKQCRTCRHHECLHFARSSEGPFCRIVGCDCKEFK